MFKNRIVRYTIAAVAAVAVVWGLWGQYASVTKVALVDFQPFQAASIIKGNDDRFVRYDIVDKESFGKLGRYDFVLGSGMGMRITAEQRAQIQAAADKGVPVYIHAATNPQNNISNLDTLQLQSVRDYLNNGNKRNYRSLAKYIRKEIDRKALFATPPEPVAETASDVLFHLDENVWFENVKDYEDYLKKINSYREDGPKVAIIGGLNNPFSGNRENIDSLIVSFQRSGMNVYPVASAAKRLDFLRAVSPDAVLYFPHGRISRGDEAVEWLKERNIPVFAPLSILKSQEEWENDPMGMFGGFLSQSVVMPELDGAIYPYVVNVQEQDDEGVYLFKAVPERLRKFTDIVSNFISLKRKPNAQKKVAIYFFKGAGQQTLVAQGLETIPSLYNLLKRLKAEGYGVENLPANEAEFERMLMSQGAVLSTYAEGAFDKFLKEGNPALVAKSEYESWVAEAMPQNSYSDVINLYGEAPGRYMSVDKDGEQYLAVARLQFGNVALLPQPMAALGDDAFAIVHGAKAAPPHSYIGAYLWAKYSFGADAMIHFGTHGSLEFTPSKQVALADNDWADILVATTPHFYYYTIANVGESMMAKRRSYATIVSYLNPPFMESNTRSQFRSLMERIQYYYKTEGKEQENASLRVKKIAVEMGLHRELRLDSLLNVPYAFDDIERIENFAEEIANEKMTGQLYTTGVAYEQDKIKTSVMAMSVDPIAYSLAALDRIRGKATERQLNNKVYFNTNYTEPAKKIVREILNGKPVDNALICRVAGVSENELEESKAVLTPVRPDMSAMMAMMGSRSGKRPHGAAEKPVSGDTSSKHSDGVSGETAKSKTGHPSSKPQGGHPGREMKEGITASQMPPKHRKKEYTKEEKEYARSVTEIERTIRNVINYQKALRNSPDYELVSLVNALSGGYVAPTSGGDAVANPRALPTGRNLYAINAEATPTEVAWDRGVELVKATLEQYKKQHDRYPRKISYTFWSSEFIESEGTTIAQALYLLGVEPVRDPFGRVSDLRLIPSDVLGRPRIDIVVQTSGQFRDLAASRLALISRAVEMASAATGDQHENYVNKSVIETERQLVDMGVSPKEAREMSAMRVFGGVNGMYGTGIQDMITAGDKWEDEKEIAETYINNMGSVYGGEQNWGEFNKGLLRAALHNTDAVVQPRQSNTWGALSLDHVYEFMGGMNLAVRNVTGKDPEAYFADYRNRHRVKMQELKEAIGVESRSTIFNPEYIKELMKGGASSAAQITEVVTNTYGWNVTKPDVIDNQMWDKIYEVYVKDSYNLGVPEFFKRQNPAAMQEITAVMMEAARKGMWKASEQQLNDIAAMHTDLVREFGATGSGFSGSNAKLQDFIAKRLDAQNANNYKEQLKSMKQASQSSDANTNGMVLKKETVANGEKGERNALNGILVVSVVLAAFVALLVILRRKRKGKR